MKQYLLLITLIILICRESTAQFYNTDLFQYNMQGRQQRGLRKKNNIRVQKTYQISSAKGILDSVLVSLWEFDTKGNAIKIVNFKKRR